MIKEITSRKNQIVIDTISLKDASTSLKNKKFIIEGEHLFEMALKAKNICYVLTNKKLNIEDDLDQYIVSDEILEKISDKKSAPNLIAVCNYFNDEIKNSNKIIYLDAVQDPGNVGTILRTSLAFSYFNIILGKGSASKYNSKVISASQGAIFNINTEIGDVETLLNLKKQGYKIISTLLDKDATKLDDLKISKDEKVIFVFGNEGQGISDEIKNISDDKVFIEMKNIDSLNVGVAASILMYKFSEK